MKSRAKFKCQGVEKTIGWGDNDYLYSARFSAVTSGNEENKSFFAATPSGDIRVSTVKEDLFEVGKEYYVDFTPSDD